MKKISILFFVLITVQTMAQQVWENLPANPNVLSNAVYDFEMIDGKVYQFVNQDLGTGFNTYQYYYNPQTSQWISSGFVVSTQMSKIITQKIGTIVYLVGYNGTSFTFWKYEYPAMNPVMVVQDYAVTSVNDNWAFETGNGPEELYILYTREEGVTDFVYGLERNPGFTWNEMSAEAYGTELSLADLQIQVTQNDVYFGVYTNKVRATRFEKGAIDVMFPYEGTGTGIIQSNGADWDNPGFALVGNKNSYVAFYGTEDANNKSYEYEMDGSTVIDVDLAAQSITNFNLDADYLAKESSASHGFIYSRFRDDGVALGGSTDVLKVIRRDFVAGTPWETVGNDILPAGTAIEPNSLQLSLDNDNKHLFASYVLQGDLLPELKVLNQTPIIYSGTTAPNTGLCVGQINEIYPDIQIEDFDSDMISIVSAISVNGTTTNINIIPSGIVNGVFKFKILGIPAAGTDQIEITYTDGFGTYTLQLDAFTPTNPSVNVQFTSNPVIFCDNDQQVDLSQYVNYYDQGTFRVNGIEVNNTIINANLLNTNFPTGLLRYVVNVDGCFITSTANYQIVASPSINMTTVATTCAGTNGSATAVVVPGAASNFDFYWNTGQTNTQISSLSPGSYYAFVSDDNNCKAIGLASIGASDVTIDETITNPSCFNTNDGSISLAISGITDYYCLWQNGVYGNQISNLAPGNYEYTLYSASGCQLRNSFQVTAPSAITNNFTLNKPDCGADNGSIISNVSGGQAPYNYLWSTTATSPNLTTVGNGFYTFKVTDGNGCIYKDSLFLNDNFATIITDSVILAACNVNNGGIDVTLIQHPQGGAVNSTVWDNGVTTVDNYNLTAGDYLLTVNSGTDCISQKSIKVGTRAPFRNDICVVTVDTASITNLVVWEKMEAEGISHYNIYRENDNAGNYLLIDTVHYSNLSVFNDVVASPVQRSWRYRIAAVNSCGVEGILSIPHKTLHLNTIAQPTPGVFDVYWDNYEGLADGQYLVYRHTDQDGWVELSPAIPFGDPTVFTDTPLPGFSGLDYFVSFDLATPCTATYRAQDFNRSRSNKEKGIFNPGSGAGDYSNNSISEFSDELVVTIYPNPSDDVLFIEFEGNQKISCVLTNIDGQIITEKTFKEGKNQLDLSKLNAGIYFIQTKVNEEFRVQKIIKN